MTQQAPYSEEAERGVLGACLTNPGAFYAVSAFLKADMFFLVRHAYIWQAMSAIAERHEPLDYTLLIAELKATNRLQDIGGAAYLTQLVDSGDSTHAEIYGRLIERAYVRRRMLEAVDQIRKAALDETQPLEAAIERATSELYMATNQSLTIDDSHIKTALHEYWDTVDSLVNGGKRGGLPTGIQSVDELLGGFYRGEVAYIGAPAGFGKTSLLTTIARNVARLNCAVVFFTVEMDRQEIARRFVVNETGIPVRVLKDGSLSQQQLQLFAQGMTQLSTLPIHIVCENTLTPLVIHRHLRRIAHETAIDLVIVDGLWLMKSHKQFKGDSARNQEVNSITEDVAAIAKSMGQRFLIAHQFNQDAKNRSNKRPQMGDFAESVGVQRNAHVLLGLYREQYYDPQSLEDRTELIALKNRDGDYGTAYMRYDARFGRYASSETVTYEQAVKIYDSHGERVVPQVQQ